MNNMNNDIKLLLNESEIAKNVHKKNNSKDFK